MLWTSESRSVTKPSLLRLLADIAATDWCRRTTYLAPCSLEGGGRGPASLSRWPAIEDAASELSRSETGTVVFEGVDRIVGVAPPFPLGTDLATDGPHTDPLVGALRRNLMVGLVLLRLGRYAVGVLRGEALVASKTGSRHVKSRHRAGGASQRRFERSRERLMREFFDDACRTVARVFSEYDRNLDYVLMGGEGHTLRQFAERCRCVQDLGPKALRRLVPVDRPGQRALDGIEVDVWRSRVVTLTRHE